MVVTSGHHIVISLVVQVDCTCCDTKTAPFQAAVPFKGLDWCNEYDNSSRWSFTSWMEYSPCHSHIQSTPVSEL